VVPATSTLALPGAARAAQRLAQEADMADLVSGDLARILGNDVVAEVDRARRAGAAAGHHRALRAHAGKQRAVDAAARHCISVIGTLEIFELEREVEHRDVGTRAARRRRGGGRRRGAAIVVTAARQQRQPARHRCSTAAQPDEAAARLALLLGALHEVEELDRVAHRRAPQFAPERRSAALALLVPAGKKPPALTCCLVR
jgi:hypothetical protein